jgi:hypothetical protein
LVGIGGHREGNAAERTFAASGLSKAESTQTRRMRLHVTVLR